MDLGREVPSKLCEQEAGVITGSPRESTQLRPPWLPQSWSARSPLAWGTAGQGQGTLWERAAGKLWHGSGPRWQELEFWGGAKLCSLQAADPSLPIPRIRALLG